MSPEVCRGEQAQTASDVYSLGITLYHMLVGRAPYRLWGYLVYLLGITYWTSLVERMIHHALGREPGDYFTPAQRRLIDRLEVGREVSPAVRLAFEVDDVAAGTDRATAAGAALVAPPTETPWRSSNARLDGPGPIHLTLFEELDDG